MCVFKRSKSQHDTSFYHRQASCTTLAIGDILKKLTFEHSVDQHVNHGYMDKGITMGSLEQIQSQWTRELLWGLLHKYRVLMRHI